MENVNLIVPRFACKANQDLKSNSIPFQDSFRQQESNGGLKISKQASVRNHVSRGKLFRIDLRETLITWYPGLCFGNQAYSWTRVDE